MGASSELESLRARKMELEFRLNELQQTRKDLMTELEELMKVLKVQGTMNNQAAKFNNKITRNQNITSQLRPYGVTPLSHVSNLTTGGGHVSGAYVRSPDTDLNNSETDSAPASNSMPASVNSLSE